MITPEQRSKFESELSSAERSMVSIGRFMKGAVLALLVASLFWIGASDDKLTNAPGASKSAPTLASNQGHETGALRVNADLGQNRSTPGKVN